MSQTDKVFLLYLPALHQGYVDWFDAHRDVNTVLILDASITEKVDHLRKDVRALSPEAAVAAVSGLDNIESVKTISWSELQKLDRGTEICAPDDDVTKFLQDKVLSQHKFNLYPIFLRWNRNNIETKIDVDYDDSIDFNKLPQDIVSLLESEALRSTDWWRRIGAILVHDNEIVLSSYNRHIPSQYTPYIDGDLRMSLNRGAGIELAGTEHAEAGVLALAASQGIKTSGLDLYTSTFPCPPCAKFIATAGIHRLFYEEGYAMGNGLEALKSAGVKVVKIKNFPDQPKSEEMRPYPEKKSPKSKSKS